MTWWDIYLYINNYLHFYVALFCLKMGTEILKQNEALILAATPNMSHLSLRAVYSVIKYS